MFDIDGVVTDGNAYIQNTKKTKCINMKDIDAINELKRMGIYICAVTAEQDEFAEWIGNNIPWDRFLCGVQDKGESILSLRKEFNIPCRKVVYIGDGKKDISALLCSDIRICPADAIDDVKNICHIILRKNAGTGGLWQLVDIARALLLSNDFPNENTIDLALNMDCSTLYELKANIECKTSLMLIVDDMKKRSKHNNSIKMCFKSKDTLDDKWFVASCDDVFGLFFAKLEQEKTTDDEEVWYIDNDVLMYKDYKIILNFTDNRCALYVIVKIAIAYLMK